MSDRMIFARAQPKSLRAIETYFYEQEVSRNPAIMPQEGRQPAGQIELTYPYDGERWFSRTAVRDVEAQTVGMGQAEALVGHLVFTDYARTNLREALDLDAHHGTVPIQIPVRGDVLRESADLVSDRYACQLNYKYIPDWPEMYPISADVQLLDEEVFERPETDLSASELLDIVSQIAQPVSFQRSLALCIEVRADLPASMKLDGNFPLLRSIRLKWPTIPSFRSLALSIGGKEQWLAFDPATSHLSWGQVLLSRQENLGAEVRRYSSEPMWLFIEQPGVLYLQSILEGEIEVELPTQLMSGVKMRLMNSTGEWVQSLTPEMSTRLVSSLRLVLEDIFARRSLSPYQHLHFDGVIPDPMRIADIKTALADHGFRIVRDHSITSDSTVLRHFIVAERKEGTDTMELSIFVEGKRYETERQTQVVGGQTYTSKFESGELKVYVRSKMPGNSRALIREMNALQSALRDRFERLRAKR